MAPLSFGLGGCEWEPPGPALAAAAVEVVASAEAEVAQPLAKSRLGERTVLVCAVAKATHVYHQTCFSTITHSKC